jgi:hypothetical protein
MLQENGFRPQRESVGRINLNGSQSEHLRELEYKRLRVRSSGSGDAILEGTVGELEIEVSGSATIDARDLKTKITTIDSSGSGTIYAHASKEFRIDASGSGKIHLYGNGEITSKDLSGSTKVFKH